MAKKKKNSNELPSINFKLPVDLKKWLTEQSSNENLTLSYYLRKHLSSFMEGEYVYEDSETYYERKLVGSPEFLSLVVWMYSKRGEEKCKIDNEKLGEYIDTLKKIRNIFPKEIETEFEKVLLDALKVRSKISEFERKFKFSREYFSGRDHNTVNFERIEDYILVERGKITLV